MRTVESDERIGDLLTSDRRTAEHGGDTQLDGMLAQLRAIEMHMHVKGAGCGDQALQSRTVVAADTIRRGSTPSVNGRVAGLADTDDAAILDAEVALNDAHDSIDYRGVAEQKIRRAFGAGDGGGQPGTVALSLAAAV